MKLLIIEDDENKRSEILSFLLRDMPQASVETAYSVHGGLGKLLDSSYDLVLLDMTMPTFDITAEEAGGRPQAYGGRAILRQMDRRKITTPVVIVTQFDRFGDAEDALTLHELNSELAR